MPSFGFLISSNPFVFFRTLGIQPWKHAGTQNPKAACSKASRPKPCYLKSHNDPQRVVLSSQRERERERERETYIYIYIYTNLALERSHTPLAQGAMGAAGNERSLCLSTVCLRTGACGFGSTPRPRTASRRPGFWAKIWLL